MPRKPTRTRGQQDYTRSLLSLLKSMRRLGVAEFKNESFCVSFLQGKEPADAIGFQVEQDEDDCEPDEDKCQSRLS